MTTDNSMEAVELLLTRAIMGVFRKYKDTDMVVPVYHDRILKALEGHIKNISYSVGARLALMPPAADTTTEEWQELVDALQKLKPEELDGLSQAIAQVSG